MRNQTVSVTAVWLALVVATVLAWLLGHHHVDASTLRLPPKIAAGILVVAFVKISLVLAYFMELRWAPYALCAVAAAWVSVEGGLLIMLFTR